MRDVGRHIMRMKPLFSVLALSLGTALALPAGATDLPGGCYWEGDHVRCLGYPFREDRAVADPVAPPSVDFPESGKGGLDMTGKPAFTAPTDSLYPERRPLGAESSADGRADRYRPLGDRDGGYYYPGTHVSPSSPLFGRSAPGGAFGRRN